MYGRRAIRIGAAVLLAGLGLRYGCDAVRPADGGQGPDLEIAMFEGGYGIGWHQDVARDYAAAHPGLEVELWGDARVDQILKPRLLRGAPPDVFHEREMPVWLLIGNDSLVPFDALLDAAPPGGGPTWRERFIPGTLDGFRSGESVYAIPSSFSAWTCWYNAKQFRENGWEIPETWAEFNALCQTIRRSGTPPLAYQGKYPIYAYYMYVGLLQRCGGLELINRINQAEPGAFNDPGAVRAAELLQDMARDHFQSGAMAMTHTESQLQFVNGTAAMIWCGVWLPNEMKESTPDDFEMRSFNIPRVEGGQGNPALLAGLGAEYVMVPRAASNPEAGQDFVRFMVSMEQAESMGRRIGVISPLKGASTAEAVGPALAPVIEMIAESPGSFRVRLDSMLFEWRNQVILPSLAALLRGEITPEAFCEEVDAGVQAALAKRDEPLPPYEPYDAAALGEAGG